MISVAQDADRSSTNQKVGGLIPGALQSTCLSVLGEILNQKLLPCDSSIFNTELCCFEWSLRLKSVIYSHPLDLVDTMNDKNGGCITSSEAQSTLTTFLSPTPPHLGSYKSEPTSAGG